MHCLRVIQRMGAEMLLQCSELLAAHFGGEGVQLLRQPFGYERELVLVDRAAAAPWHHGTPNPA